MNKGIAEKNKKNGLNKESVKTVQTLQNIKPLKPVKTVKNVKLTKTVVDISTPKKVPIKEDEPKKPKKTKNPNTSVKISKKKSKSEIVEDPESSEESPDNRDIDQMIQFVIREVHHLRYKDRVDILCIIKEQVGTEVIYESSDGSRVQMKKLGDEIIKQIHTLVVGRLKEVDIISDS